MSSVVRHSPCAQPARSRRLSVAVVALLGFAAALPASAGAAGTATSMVIQSENLRQPNSSQDPRYFGVDDFMNWTVTGQIAPGDSYTYTPKWPISWASEVPDMSASLRWTGATTLRMTSVVPMNDQVSAADPRVNHDGQTISAPLVGNSAELCMFFVPTSAVPTFNYSITVTNTGTVAATGITLSGQESNGYAANYGPFCNRADADGDGWNDSLEEGITDLTNPAVGTATQQDEVLGVDYLQGRSTTTAVNDEVDSYPPDVNDDGIVNQADVDEISGWVGQGSGVPLAHVDYSGIGPNRYQAQSALWRRYDLNGDGMVTAADVGWVRAEVGRPVPDPVDVLAPAVSFDNSTGTSFARRTSVWLGAYARDNRALTGVRFAINGTPLTQQCTDPNTEMANPAYYHDPSTAQYQCPWTTPGKRASVTLTITATDAAGNTSTLSVPLTVN
jgi:Dockerin type I domain